ncbi:MAG: pyridoxal phosphate-dependent aminotransferase [bacterium]|nr:pyridoxal phosphate-dependent aminotransferase [bacterium]MBU1918754.1 pyridoxal phosphate-dependent aminotransferase [bacterium]
MKSIAARMNRIKPSTTLAITARGKELKALGKDIVPFGAGEPDFDTPVYIKEAAKKAIDDGQTRYTAVPGTNELKDALIQKLKKENDLTYTRDEVMVTNGGKHALFQIFMALVEAGDEVIVPAPYWVSYPDQIALFGGKPVLLETTDQTNFKITPQQLKEAITEKTIAFIINSPSNPSGAAYHPDELQELAQICLKNNIYIISDEIYEHIIYDDFPVRSPASLAPAFKDITIIANGASKCFAMTGWRMGFAAGPAPLIKAMSKAQGQSTSNVCSITQAACVAAYTETTDVISQMTIAFKERRDYIVPALNGIEGISCNTPQGAFYVFPNITALLGKKTPKGLVLQSTADFCLSLLEDYHVATVPGSAFGVEGYIRISYATGMEEIKKGIKRIETMVAELV